MNKKEFESKRTEIQSKIESMQQELRDLEKEYIDSNAKFPIGSKVCITSAAGKRFAYIVGYEIR